MDLTSTPYLRKLAAFAAAHGYKITAGGAHSGHNPGSLHYLGRAIDVSVHGKTDSEVEAFIRRAGECGFRVLDERHRMPGEAVWTGPHLHIEDRTGM